MNGAMRSRAARRLLTVASVTIAVWGAILFWLHGGPRPDRRSWHESTGTGTADRNPGQMNEQRIRQDSGPGLGFGVPVASPATRQPAPPSARGGSPAFERANGASTKEAPLVSWTLVTVSKGFDPVFGNLEQRRKLRGSLLGAVTQPIDECFLKWAPPPTQYRDDGVAILEGDLVLSLEAYSRGYVLVSTEAIPNERTRWTDDSILACLEGAVRGLTVSVDDLPSMTHPGDRFKMAFPFRKWKSVASARANTEAR